MTTLTTNTLITVLFSYKGDKLRPLGALAAAEHAGRAAPLTLLCVAKQLKHKVVFTDASFED